MGIMENKSNRHMDHYAGCVPHRVRPCHEEYDCHVLFGMYFNQVVICLIFILFDIRICHNYGVV